MPQVLADIVYLLCFLTAALAAGLLVRQFRMVRSPVLLWSAACFVLLALSNLLVVVDELLVPDVFMRQARLGLTLLAVTVLLYGFIWEAEQDR